MLRSLNGHDHNVSRCVLGSLNGHDHDVSRCVLGSLEFFRCIVPGGHGSMFMVGHADLVVENKRARVLVEGPKGPLGLF